MPFKFAPDKTGEFKDCVKFYTGKKNKRTGKKFTKKEAGAVCATIEKRQKKKHSLSEDKLTSGKFSIAIHQLGLKKYLDIYLETPEKYSLNWAFKPVKVAEKIKLIVGSRVKLKGKAPTEMIGFSGTIPIGKPGASRNFVGILKLVDSGTYETLEQEGGRYKYKFNGKHLNGIFNIIRDDEDIIENYKYRYIFSRQDNKESLTKELLAQIETLSMPEDARIAEKLSFKGKPKVLKELLKNGKIVPLRIKGIALKEGIWNGLFYPSFELRRAADMLKGKPLMMDHVKSVSSLSGKVVSSYFDEDLKALMFEADVLVEDTARKVLNDLVDSVSVGIIVDRVKEGSSLVARNYEFSELSLVLIPACDAAKITDVVLPE